MGNGRYHFGMYIFASSMKMIHVDDCLHFMRSLDDKGDTYELDIDCCYNSTIFGWSDDRT